MIINFKHFITEKNDEILSLQNLINSKNPTDVEIALTLINTLNLTDHFVELFRCIKLLGGVDNFLTFINSEELTITDDNIDAFQYAKSAKKVSITLSKEKSKITNVFDFSFDNVEEFVISFSSYLNIRITKFPNLKSVSIIGVSTSDLEIENCDKLSYIKIDSSNVNNINLKNLKSLESFDFEYSKFTEIAFPINTKLKKIAMLYSVGDINFNNLQMLEMLKITNCNLLELDLQSNKKLTMLDCSENNIQNLNVSNNTQLVFLNCLTNNLNELDLSKNINLIDVNCVENQIKIFDFQHNKNLKTFAIQNGRKNRVILPNSDVVVEFTRYTKTHQIKNKGNFAIVIL